MTSKQRKPFGGREKKKGKIRSESLKKTLWEGGRRRAGKARLGLIAKDSKDAKTTRSYKAP